MGQKTHPRGFRLGITKEHRSKWFANGRDYGVFVHQDEYIRKFLSKKLEASGVSFIEIERAAGSITITIHTARPGLVIGKKGAGIDSLRLDLQNKIKEKINVNIKEVRKAEVDPQLVAENIARQLERRVSFRRAMKKAVQSAMKLGAEGVKIRCSGRLGGAEIARSEWCREGRVPLHTLRADVDYGYTTANTTYGVIGVKVWVCKDIGL